KGYGHEDTYFGYQMEMKKIPVVHIENPVLHNKLEDNLMFLSKTEMALDNLLRLDALDAAFAQRSALLTALHKIEKSNMLGISAWWFRKRENILRSNLRGDHPSLR